MIENLKDLKDTYEHIRSQIDSSKEPMEEMMKLHKFMGGIRSDFA
jgi:succinate dehydrogenase/fumarate reductase flavoprotein subunit